MYRQQTNKKKINIYISNICKGNPITKTKNIKRIKTDSNDDRYQYFGRN